VRIRLSSLEPNEIGEDLIEMAAAETWLCPHFHIPLQSGDDGVLDRMNRTYRAGDFSRLVRGIHERIPHAAVGADVMCGFPGESDAAHGNTRSLIRDLPVSYLHVFPYSRRKGTAAYGFGSHPDSEVVRQRAEEMRAVGKEKRLEFFGRCLGGSFEVLTEGRDPKAPGFVKGTSDNYLPVRFEAETDDVNRMAAVRMERIAGQVMLGRTTA
jgi:threonylcarbamoyladenosine tRNA methylthiotransferase MtaB